MIWVVVSRFVGMQKKGPAKIRISNGSGFAVRWLAEGHAAFCPWGAVFLTLVIAWTLEVRER